MADERLEMFAQRYQDQNTPWDTGITPPEIVAVLQELPPAKAIDLGCGTGTNVRYLLEKGWQADGVDFVPQAIETAQAKLSAFPAEHFKVFCHDVTRLEECAGLRPPYDLAVDIGCGHGVEPSLQSKYAQDVANLLKQRGVFMLYTHHPSETRALGWAPSDVQRLFSPFFDIVWQITSDDTTTGAASSWHRLTKR